MTEPERLIDLAEDDLEVALLSAGRGYRASPRARTRTLAAVAAVGSSTLLAKSAVASGLWALKTWIAGGLILGGAAAALYVNAQHVPTPPPALEATAPAPAPDPAAVPPESGATNPVASAPLEAAPSAAPAPPPTRSPSTGAAARASLTEELAALDAASAALRGGDAARAQLLLDDHARRFPRGRLRLEASVLRIEALAQSGQRAAAASRARAFLARHPNSVLAARVKRYATP